MRIKTKILWLLLGMCALVALVGGHAILRQRAVGIMETNDEAQEDARVMAFIVAADHDPAHALSEGVVQYMYEKLGRDVEVVDTTKRIIADAIPAEVGTASDHRGGELGQTLSDGQVRTFFETSRNHSLGTRLIVVPVKTGTGQVIGAVTEDYTPIYNEFVAITATTTRQVVAAALAGVVIAVLLSLSLGASIASPLRQLTMAATGFAAGQTGLAMPPPRKDEIGDLTIAFKVMMDKRQQAEEALARERARLADILDSMPAVVFENGKFGDVTRTFVNSHVEEMYGYTPEEWFSTRDFWMERIHPEDREGVLTNVRKILTGEIVVDGNNGKSAYRWLTKDNRVIWGETYLTVIRDSSGATTGVRGFTLDITEQKQAEQELEYLHLQLIDASRAAGMADVATNVLHNVGNVLNSVNVSATVAGDHIRESSAPHLGRVVALIEKNAGNLGAYLTTDPTGRKLPEFLGKLAGQLESEHAAVLGELDQLRKNVEHIKDIVAMQQNYASAAGMSQTVAVADLVDDSLRMNAGALARHDVHLAREFEVQPVIQVDKHKVMQILVNLIRNAKYACDDSGRTDKRLTLRITSDERTVRISVIDNGVGIPAENLTRIFSHGFTTRKEGHGFGLHSGALTAKELGGALLVQSEGPGRGATFTLELPFKTQLPL